MNDEAVCRTAPATPGLSNIIAMLTEGFASGSILQVGQFSEEAKIAQEGSSTSVAIPSSS